MSLGKNLATPSPGGAHTQQLSVAQGSQALQQEAGAAVREQELGVALLVVQRTQQHTGPPQFRGGDRPGRVGGVGLAFSRQEQKLTILTEPLLLQREGDKRSEPVKQLQWNQIHWVKAVSPSIIIKPPLSSEAQRLERRRPRAQFT